jgi:hypothetical protein
MKTGVLFVHGIGRFSSSVFRQQVAPVMSRFAPDSIEWDVFNWDLLSPDPLRDLRRVASAAFSCMHMHAEEAIPNSGLRGALWLCHNQLCWLCQIGAAVLPVMIIGNPIMGGAALRITSLTLAVTMLLALALGLWTLGDVWVPIRRIAFTILWPTVHIVGVPMHVILFGRFSVLALALIFGPVFAFLFGSAAFHVYDVMQAPMLGAITLGETFKIARNVLMILIAAVVLLVSKREWGYLTSVKLTADIVRYIGDAAYRKILRDALTMRIAVLMQSYDQLVIIAHSLGTAIASDVLTGDNTLVHGKGVVFVTMGSPIRRLLLRFFPGIFSTPEQIAHCLQTHASSFRWINVYRPLD